MKRNGVNFDSPWLAITGLALLALLVSLPLFSCDWFISHEDTRPLQRIIALTEEIRQGDLYPRWLSLTYFGKGSPFFNFYSPLSYLLPAYLYAAGVPLLTAVKGVILCYFFLGALGMYLWVRCHFGNFGAQLAAILYLFAPYHFVDLYVRGAYAEFAALAILPYLFWAIDLTLDRHRAQTGILATAAASALLLLTHHLSALMIAPLAMLYSLLRVAAEPQPRLNRIGRLLLGTSLGAGLSAFYWLPLLQETRHLHDITAAVTTGKYSFSMHFVTHEQWVSTFWGFGFSNPPGQPDGMSFQLGVVLIAALLLTLVTVHRTPPHLRRYVAILLLGAGLSLFLTTAASSWLYQHLPALAFVQFPWRFLGPATLFGTATVGALTFAPLLRRHSHLTLLLLICASLYFSSQQRSVPEPVQADIERDARELIAARGVGSLCSANEYLPRWAPSSSMALRSSGLPVMTAGHVAQPKTSSTAIEFLANVTAQESLAIVPVYYFPGWEARVDGHPTPLYPSTDGLLALTIPQGDHQVRIFFGTTPPRIAGWVCTLVTFAGIIIYAGAQRLCRRQDIPPESHRL